MVLGQGCKLSMDGRGAWRENVFVERLWRSARQERVYLKTYDGVSAARADIADDPNGCDHTLKDFYRFKPPFCKPA